MSPPADGPAVGRVQGGPAAAHAEPGRDAGQCVAADDVPGGGAVAVTGAAATLDALVRMTSAALRGCSPGPVAAPSYRPPSMIARMLQATTRADFVHVRRWSLSFQGSAPTLLVRTPKAQPVEGKDLGGRHLAGRSARWPRRHDAPAAARPGEEAIRAAPRYPAFRARRDHRCRRTAAAACAAARSGLQAGNSTSATPAHQRQGTPRPRPRGQTGGHAAAIDAPPAASNEGAPGTRGPNARQAGGGER